MKTLCDMFRFVVGFCVVVAVRIAIHQVLTPATVQPQIEWSQLEAYHDLQDRQIPQQYFPTRTQVGLFPDADQPQPVWHFNTEAAPTLPDAEFSDVK